MLHELQHMNPAVNESSLDPTIVGSIPPTFQQIREARTVPLCETPFVHSQIARPQFPSREKDQCKSVHCAIITNIPFGGSARAWLTVIFLEHVVVETKVAFGPQI